MDKDKSILEKFTDTVKDMANSASEALKAEEPPKVEQTNAAYMPFAAEGLVSDPLLIPPVAAQPPRRKRTARKQQRSHRRGKRRPSAPRRRKRERPQRHPRAASRSGVAERGKGFGQADHQKTTKRRSAKRPAGAQPAVIGVHADH